MQGRLSGCVQDEDGAEMVEWVVVVVVLAVISSIVFGPTGVLSNTLLGGINSIAMIIDGIPTSS
jgi:Flp pilus assembly pilin Flp